jgi:hypothetical protein
VAAVDRQVARTWDHRLAGNNYRQQVMAKAKKTKPRGRLLRWRVSMITGTPAKFIDFALAPDAETAEKQVAEEHEIEETLRHRLVAIREDL